MSLIPTGGRLESAPFYEEVVSLRDITNDQEVVVFRSAVVANEARLRQKALEALGASSREKLQSDK